MIETEQQACDWLRQIAGCDDAMMAQLEQLVALLAEENQRQNLIAAATLPSVWQRHIVDSAQLVPIARAHTDFTGGPWLDLGTGAGFPGLVVALLLPDVEILMVESRSRRVEWLERACAALGLENGRVVKSRLELVESQPCSVISARAFAPLDRLVALAARFSTADTMWLLPKGRSARQEVEQLRGWQHTFHVEHSITDPEAGIVVGTLARSKGRKQ